MQNCVEFRVPQSMKDKDALERAQRRPMKMIQGLKTMPCEGLRKFRLFSPEKRRLKGDLITLFEYLNGSYREDRDLSSQGEDKDKISS